MQQMSIHAAMEHAMLAREQILMGGLEGVAWSDCLDLHDSTVRQLNRSLGPSRLRVGYDVRTWLSAALTNLHTCRAGLAELHVPSSWFVPLLTNASELVRNALAITETRAEEEGRKGGGAFPEWSSVEDRELLRARRGDVVADLVVAKDGSGDFGSIKEAINEASRRRGRESRRFVIYVKAGVYVENVQVGVRDLMLVGDGIGKTVVTGSRSVAGGSTTFNSATVAVMGDGFIARGITFRNTAGPAKRQAVALRCNADLAVFYRCSFEGYQDTLYAHSLRQFYRECDVHGTVDFIFGNAAAVLQDCNIYVRRPMSKQQNTITAQGRTDPSQNTGIVIQHCRVTAAPDLRPVQGKFRTYLGRPWQAYSRTVFMGTYMDDLISAAGWLEWSGGFALNTLYYGEYKNTGPGSDTSRRVRWRGHHVITDPSTALRFTVRGLLSGGSWLPATGVPFTDGP
ncbi:pectinesterase-like isoform X2 [Musa acuminata AAA Group]